MNKTAWIIIVAIAIAGAAWFFMTKPASAPAAPETETATSTAPVVSAEMNDLNAITVSDADFSAIDADVDSL